ncbi:MAG: magnesium transporter [Acidobacteria bacterium]|nr:magnesium transporter [Acidobacteriota bacterium]
MPEQAADIDAIRELRALLQEGEEEALRIFLRLIRPEDIADWLDHLSQEERQRLLAALDHDAAGTVLDDTTPSIRAELVEEMEPERLARIAETMPLDEAADLIGELEDEEGEAVLQHIGDEDGEVLRDLLEYDEDTAGGIMNPEVVALPADATVDDAIRVLRTSDENTVTAAVYVVDPDNRLQGIVRLRRLVTAPPDARLGQIMTTDVIAVPVESDQEDVADVVEKYDFLAVPVIDSEGRLLGAVTVDDIIDVIEEEATEDIYKMAGSSAEEEESESLLHIARYRLPWLLICLGGTQLSTSVMGFYSGRVPMYEQVSIFTPAIMAMGGNTSLQSSTTTVRQLALDNLPRKHYLVHVLREIGVALIMGVVCGIVEAGIAYLFHGNPIIGAAVGIAMALGMSAASLLGAAMPIALTLLGIDPAVASGPLVSTINDSLGLAIYFTTATVIMLHFA